MSSTIDSSNKKEMTALQAAAGGDNVPSGFILKLFQMVNGAPDEVIRVSFFFAHSFVNKRGHQLVGEFFVFPGSRPGFHMDKVLVAC